MFGFGTRFQEHLFSGRLPRISEMGAGKTRGVLGDRSPTMQNLAYMSRFPAWETFLSVFVLLGTSGLWRCFEEPGCVVHSILFTLFFWHCLLLDSMTFTRSTGLPKSLAKFVDYCREVESS